MYVAKDVICSIFNGTNTLSADCPENVCEAKQPRHPLTITQTDRKLTRDVWCRNEREPCTNSTSTFILQIFLPSEPFQIETLRFFGIAIREFLAVNNSMARGLKRVCEFWFGCWYPMRCSASHKCTYKSNWRTAQWRIVNVSKGDRFFRSDKFVLLKPVLTNRHFVHSHQ